MKRIFTLLQIVLLLIISINSWSSTNIYSGNVSGTWNIAGSPYLINGDITIPKDSTLVVAPGVKIEFKGSYQFNILGQLLAIGKAKQFIQITADDSIRGWKGIRFDGISAKADSSKLIYCKISFGKAVSGSFNDKQGGALFIRRFSNLLVENCMISNNTAAYYGGAIACVYGSSPLFVNNVICNNQSNSIGGAFYLFANSNPKLINNTIVNNHSNSAGGGIYSDNSVPTIHNSILWGNTAKTFDQIYPLSLNRVSYSDVEDGYNGQHNFRSNPAFTSPSAGSGTNYNGLAADWSLSVGSACINTGVTGRYNTFIPDFDIDGNIRIDMDSLDVGALEYIGSTVVCGNVYFNTTWSGYILVDCDLTVNNNVSLTIQPGTKIRFAGSYKLKVNGRIHAVGTPGSPIIFSAVFPTGGWKGIRFEYTSSANDSSVFEYCVFRDGYAKGTGLNANGGGMLVKNCNKLKLFNCVFSNNRANLGGALFVEDCNPVVNNCLFVNNEANYGGGLYANPYNNWQINNNTFTHNHAIYNGGGVYVYGSKTLIFNSIVYGNTAGSDPQVYPSNAAVQYSCVQSGHPGTGNISANPQFRFQSAGMGYDYEGYDYRNWSLKSTSHCIDSGYSSLSGIYLPKLDLAGKTRIFGNAVDMGAYEDKSSITVCDTIKSDTAWDANKVKINCDIVINEGVTLTIKAGTVVEFQGKYSIEVKGRILAEGTQQDSILFTSLNTLNGWKGIRYSFLLNTVNDSSKYTYCIFEYGNPSSSHGGALYIYRSHKIILDHCNFRYNKAATSGSNGGAIYLRVANIIIRNSKFLNNLAESHGGAIYCNSSNAIIENNIFYKNQVISDFGGAIFVNTSDFPLIRNNHFTNNSSKYGGGLAIKSFTNASIVSNLFTNNTALLGGALYIYSDCMPWLNNNTISNNHGSQGGGGMYLDNNSDPVLKNCIIFNNTVGALYSGKQVYINDVSSDPKIYFSDIEGGKSAFGGNGSGVNYNGVYNNNYSVDPNYASASSGSGTTYDGLSADWGLQDGSAAINAGTKDTVGLKLSANDYLKNPRIFNGRIDLGAVENQNYIVECGTLTSNTVWDADTVKINCDLVVDDGVTLTVEAGTVVQFQDNYFLEVRGRLLVNGTADKNVLFTVADTAMYDDMDTTKGGWGGLIFYSVATTNDSSIIQYATFKFGKASGNTNQDMYGGALFVYNTSKLAFINCHFSNNRAKYKGGAIYMESSSPVFMNNTISNNSAWGLKSGSYYVSYGGGLYLDDVNSLFINNTIVHNEARNGGGAYLWASSPTYKNCIFYGNRSFTNLWYYGHQLSLSQGSIPSFYYCDVEGGLTYIPNYNYINTYLNNIDADPQFYFPSAAKGAAIDGIFSNWSLQSSSACINAGTPNVGGLNLFITDRAGNKRIVADTVDIGSYENQISYKFLAQQPQSKVVCNGSSVSFSVSASISLNYQWQKDGNNISGANTSTYIIPVVSLADSGNYSCILSNNYGSLNSDTVSLTVHIPPSITQHPSHYTSCLNDSATFSVSAIGTPPIQYQWYNTNGLISGATNSTYTINAVSLNDASSYYCKATNMCGNDQSNGATLSIKTSPSISSLSPTYSVCEDNSISLTASASGSTPIYYQWFKDFSPISGATSTLYEILNADTVDMGNYYCKATNVCGSDSTNIAYLTVNTNPTISAQTSPNSSICAGQSMTFSVTALGASPLSYQWYYNSAKINGATNNTYAINSVQASDAGVYYCIVSNYCSSKTSDAINFVVKTAPSLTSQSGKQSICEGQAVSLSVTAGGTSPINYQWYFDNSAISNANSSSLIISPVSLSDGGDYYCEVSNVCGTVSSNVNTLTVKTKPTIISYTNSTSRCSGSQMTFSVNTSGTPPLNYQWYFNNQAIQNATASIYSAIVDTTDAGDYYCWISNDCDSVKTGLISLLVKIKPEITSHPVSVRICEDINNNTSFSLTARGASPLNYQWFVNGDSILGASAAQLLLNGIYDSMAGNYYCVVENACGIDQSIPAILTVDNLPVVITNTDTATLCEGSNLFMNVKASGSSPFSYQWYFDNSVVSGAISNFYILNSINATQAGDYYCEVSNMCGSTDGDVVQLNVNIPLSILSQSADSAKCENSFVIFDVHAAGNSPINYQWHGPQGKMLNDTSNTLHISSLKTSDAGFYHCEISNICGIMNSNANKLIVYPNPNVSLGNDTVFCKGGSVMLSPGSGYFCLWNNGSINPQFEVTESGDYYVHLTDIHGCTAYSDTVHVGVLTPFEGEEICLVSGDPVSLKNLVAWERTKGKRTAYYNVYRESTSSGFYDLIGVRPFDSVSVFVDVGSKPRQRAYRYTISAVDSCGNESELSYPHKTIHLTVNQGVGNTNNLIWSHYEGFSFGTYRIYRGTHPDSLLLIDSIQSSLNSYTDLSPPSGLLYYQVGVVMPDTCSPTILRGQTSKGPFSQSYSNMKDYSMDQTDYFEVNPGEINLASAYGSSGRLEVFTNLSEWEVSSNQSWLNVSREEDKSGIILTALSENTLAYARTAIMTIYLNELPPKDVIVYQLGTNGTVGLNEQLQGKLTIYPNPFNQSTQIILPAFEEFINSYQLFDASGKIVREDEYMYANRISLQKGKLAKGVYYIRIQAKLTYVGKVIVY